MLRIYRSYTCSCESANCIYCVSRVQQAHEVAKLFQSSYQNSNNNYNINRHHHESPPTFSQRRTLAPIAPASSSFNTIPQYQIIQPNLQQTLPLSNQLSLHAKVHVDVKKRRKCECPNCNAKDDNKVKGPNGKPLHICHRPGCTKMFVTIRNLKWHLISHSGKKNFICAHCNRFFYKHQLISHVKIHMKQKQGPSAEGDNETTGFDGNPLHVCPVAQCAKNLASKTSLKRHLEWHKGRKNFFCEYCKEGFQYKYNLKSHITRHINGLKITKRTRCQCPYCSVEGDNKTRGPNGKPLHICHIVGCTKIFARRNGLKKHLDWHSSEKKRT